MKLAEMFPLKPEDEKKIHPSALKVFNDWKADLFRAVPQLGELEAHQIDTDVSAYLNNGERAGAAKDTAVIMGGLRECMITGDEYSPHFYAINTIMPMFNVKTLLKKVYERKAAKAKEDQRKQKDEEKRRAEKAREEQKKREEQAEAERKKKEEEEKWQAALKALEPPLRDAKMFLNPEEYDEFEESVIGAVDAHLVHGEFYPVDSRATQYLMFTTRIENRRNERRWETAAESKAREYNRSLNKEIAKLRSVLYPKKQDTEGYFKKETKDRRYTGRSFVPLLLPDEKQALDTDVKRIAREKLENLVPDDFYGFVDWKYWKSFFLLPSAGYSFEGVPCLDFSFDIFAVVEAKVWLKSEQKSFGGYIFTFPQIEHKCDPYASFFTELREPEFLGYHYLLLTPYNLGSVFWQSIPLVLIQGLMNGNVEPAGTTIVEASESETTYRIKGFKDEVTIPDSFACYLKEIGGIDEMVSIGLISKKVANIAEKWFSVLETEERTALAPYEQAAGYEDEDLVSSLPSVWCLIPLAR